MGIKRLQSAEAYFYQRRIAVQLLIAVELIFYLYKKFDNNINFV